MDIEDMRQCLRLHEAGAGRFEGRNYRLDYHRVFGGQILAQTIAVLATMAEGMSVKSLTQVFSREGDAARPVLYVVDERHRGRSFATIEVTAVQGDRTIGCALASLHRPDEGYERQDDAPDVGSPGEAAAGDIPMLPWETRVVGGTDLQAPDTRPANFSFWMRADVDEPEPWFHQALLAHATDLTVIGTGLLGVEGISQADTGRKIHTAVTSHTLWFHQGFRMDDWILVDQSSPILSGGRCFGRGDVWTADGRLVASFAQESVVRPLART